MMPCEGIYRDQSAGVLPRCLILERRDEHGRGCLVTGINPGRSSDAEPAYYHRHGTSYDAVVAYWHERVRGIRYYARLRRLVDQIGLSGPILWSDLAKCENAPSVDGLIPLETLRRCNGRFLHRELAVLPAEWPILGVDLEAYKALAYMVPDRTVLGVPHPTGSRGQFVRLFRDELLVPEVAAEARAALASSEPVILWL
jgi:hypothetical protein